MYILRLKFYGSRSLSGSWLETSKISRSVVNCRDPKIKIVGPDMRRPKRRRNFTRALPRFCSILPPFSRILFFRPTPRAFSRVFPSNYGSPTLAFSPEAISCRRAGATLQCRNHTCRDPSQQHATLSDPKGDRAVDVRLEAHVAPEKPRFVRL